MKARVASLFLIGQTLLLLAIYHFSLLRNVLNTSENMKCQGEVLTNELKTDYTKGNSHIVDFCDEEDSLLLLSQATSGEEFSGVKFRTFPEDLHKFNRDDTIISSTIKMPTSNWNCTKWGVVTTIFAPPKQEAVRRFLYRTDWCIAVVGDKTKPKVRFFFVFLYF